MRLAPTRSRNLLLAQSGRTPGLAFSASSPGFRAALRGLGGRLALGADPSAGAACELDIRVQRLPETEAATRPARQLSAVSLRRDAALAAVQRDGAALVIIPGRARKPHYQNHVPSRDGAAFGVSLFAGEPPDGAGADARGGGDLGALAQPGPAGAAGVHAAAWPAGRGDRVDRGGAAGLSARHFTGADRVADLLVLADPDLHFRGPVSAAAARAALRQPVGVRGARVPAGAARDADAGAGRSGGSGGLWGGGVSAGRADFPASEARVCGRAVRNS